MRPFGAYAQLKKKKFQRNEEGGDHMKVATSRSGDNVMTRWTAYNRRWRMNIEAGMAVRRTKKMTAIAKCMGFRAVKGTEREAGEKYVTDSPDEKAAYSHRPRGGHKTGRIFPNLRESRLMPTFHHEYSACLRGLLT